MYLAMIHMLAQGPDMVRSSAMRVLGILRMVNARIFGCSSDCFRRQAAVLLLAGVLSGRLKPILRLVGTKPKDRKEPNHLKRDDARKSDCAAPSVSNWSESGDLNPAYIDHDHHKGSRPQLPPLG